MKNLHKVLCIVTIITACLFFAPLTHAGWADFLKKVKGGTKKIRKDPAARVTDLLKEVFGTK